MDCSTLKPKLTAYLAHEFPVEERSVVRQHLEQCPKCQAELDSLEQLNHLLDLQPVMIPPTDLTDSIMAAIAQEGTQKAKDLSWTDIIAWGTALIAGLCLVIIPAFVWYWQRTTGMMPWQSFNSWSSTEAGTLIHTSSAGLTIVTSIRQWLLSIPQSISLWVQTQAGGLASFYTEHLTELLIAVVALAAATVLSVRLLSRWSDEWEDSAGIKGWRN